MKMTASYENPMKIQAKFRESCDTFSGFFSFSGYIESILFHHIFYDTSTWHRRGWNPRNFPSWPFWESSFHWNPMSSLSESGRYDQADYQNLVKRHDRDTAELGFILIAPVMKKLLPTLDNLERALESKKDVTDDPWINGIRSTYEWLVKTLDSLGVKPFVSLWKEVDSELHDVMTQGPWKEGVIVAEMEKWYMLHDRVLRHAKVVVGSGDVSE